MKAGDIELVSANDVTDDNTPPTGASARPDSVETPANHVTNTDTGEIKYQFISQNTRRETETLPC